MIWRYAYRVLARDIVKLHRRGCLSRKQVTELFQMLNSAECSYEEQTDFQDKASHLLTFLDVFGEEAHALVTGPEEDV